MVSTALVQFHSILSLVTFQVNKHFIKSLLETYLWFQITMNNTLKMAK